MMSMTIKKKMPDAWLVLLKKGSLTLTISMTCLERNFLTLMANLNLKETAKLTKNVNNAKNLKSLYWTK